MPPNYMTDEAVDEPESVDSPSEESGESGEKTALIPISFFQGKELEPGSTCSVKVVSVEDDQVQVSYVAHEEEEASEEASMPPEMGEEQEDMMA